MILHAAQYYSANRRIEDTAKERRSIQLAALLLKAPLHGKKEDAQDSDGPLFVTRNFVSGCLVLGSTTSLGVTDALEKFPQNGSSFGSLGRGASCL